MAFALLRATRKVGSILRNEIKARPIDAFFVSCGSGFRIWKGCEIIGNSNAIVGNNVNLGSHACIPSTKAKLTLEDDVFFRFVRRNSYRRPWGGYSRSFYVEVIGDAEKLSENDQDDVLVGDNFIGSNATILKGVTVDRGAVRASGAVVNKDVTDFFIVGGLPAEVMGSCLSRRESNRTHDE